jgi:hypothetical protein
MKTSSSCEFEIPSPENPMRCRFSDVRQWRINIDFLQVFFPSLIINIPCKDSLVAKDARNRTHGGIIEL